MVITCICYSCRNKVVSVLEYSSREVGLGGMKVLVFLALGIVW